MSVQRVTITTYAPTIAGNVSRIALVGQSVTGPAGADGAGVSVATKESGTEKVAVTTSLDFGAGFDVAGASGVASVSLDLTEYTGGALPLANGGTGATTATDARTALGLGTAATQASSAFDAAGAAAAAVAAAASSYATAAQGAKADTAVQPATLTAHVDDTTDVHGITDTSLLVASATVDSIVTCSQATYDGLTPAATTLYIITG